MSKKKLVLISVIIFVVLSGIGIAVQLAFGIPAFGPAASVAGGIVAVFCALNIKKKPADLE